MAEQEFEIKPVGVKYICDKCGEGEMLPDGDKIFLKEPPFYPHKCNKCGYEFAFNKRYPTMAWKLA